MNYDGNEPKRGAMRRTDKRRMKPRKVQAARQATKVLLAKLGKKG